MLNAHVDYIFYVVVVEGIDNRFTFLAIFNKARVFQHSQLVRDRRHTHTKLFRYIANAHFALEKQIQYLYTGAVTHNGEKLGEIKKMLVVGQGNFIQYFAMRFVGNAKGDVIVLVFHSDSDPPYGII